MSQQKKKTKLPSKTLIFSTPQEYLVQLYLGKLKAHGIQATILNNKDSMYNNFGNFELYVMPEDVVKAKYILEKEINE